MGRRRAAIPKMAAARTPRSSNSARRSFTVGLLAADSACCLVALGFCLYGTPHQAHVAVTFTLGLGLLTSSNMLLSLREQRKQIKLPSLR
jgi:hypothetical protein